jgi:hypothetical protein
LPPVSTTPVVHLELRKSQQLFEKFETAQMGYSGVWGKLIHEKTWNRKSRGNVPLKGHANKTDFLNINRFGIGPLHNCKSLFDFGFDFLEIFLIENRLRTIADAGSRQDCPRQPFLERLNKPFVTMQFTQYDTLSWQLPE